MHNSGDQQSHFYILILTNLHVNNEFISKLSRNRLPNNTRL